MTTYGSSRTAKNHPKTPVLTKLDQQILELQNRRDIIASACAHHFVPQEGVVERLKKTLVNGVYKAGSISEIGAISDVYFTLQCTKCGKVENVSLTGHCPICGGAVKGEWGSINEIERYFGKGNFSFNGIWLISCISCDFKAAGLRWDQ
ncbi:MAG: hypothetical protein Q8R36_01745 [bacterium]|nr:hypothetical protein [bacterium]